MVIATKSTGALVLRLLVALALLGCARAGSAQGSWSVISLTPKPGEVVDPSALAADAAGNLYVADLTSYDRDRRGRIQKRDVQGTWSVLASFDGALAVDGAGNLYVTEFNNSRIQKRDAQGNWSTIATAGQALGQVTLPVALAADGAGDLYVVDMPNNGRIQKRDTQGNWSVIATAGSALGQVNHPGPLAVDRAGNLYVADGYLPDGSGRIQRRDAQGNCYENRIPGPVQARGTPTAPRLAAATGR